MTTYVTTPAPRRTAFEGPAGLVNHRLIAELARLRAHNAALTKQLGDSRTVGMAIGIIADKLKLRTDRAEEVLGAVAAELGLDVAETAHHLVCTGRLP